VNVVRKNEVTRVLDALGSGDPKASAELLTLIYDELRKLAAVRIASEPGACTLQATGLVHEAYIRLVGNEAGASATWDSRGHFFSAAAEAMRRILIDRARERHALKRGGGWRKLELDPSRLVLDAIPAELLDLDRALSSLAAEDPKLAELVKLRFFAGLSISEAAEMLSISPSTADRQWAYARAWLFRFLRGSGTVETGT
jgi:RNA polymerase sigma factor (TIGR02999 family)